MIDARHENRWMFGPISPPKNGWFYKGVDRFSAPVRLEFTSGRFSQRETAGPYRLTTAGCIICPIFIHEKNIMKSWSSKMFKFWYVLPPSSPQISFLGWSQLFDIFCNLSGCPRNLASMYPGETPRIGQRKPL